MAERVAEYLDDPNLLSLKLDIAIASERLGELGEQLDALDDVTVQELVRMAWTLDNELDHAAFTGDTDDAIKEARHLVEYIARCAERNRVWDDYLRTQKHRSELAEKEHKRMSSEAVTLNAAKAYAMVGAISSILRTAIDEVLEEHDDLRRLLNRRIARDMRQILPLPTRQPALDEGTDTDIASNIDSRDGPLISQETDAL
jgi:hypothetical protein